MKVSATGASAGEGPSPLRSAPGRVPAAASATISLEMDAERPRGTLRRGRGDRHGISALREGGPAPPGSQASWGAPGSHEIVDGAFWLRLALSFVLGGLAVAVFTTIAERRGSRLGGLLLSFPVKVVVSLVLIGLNEGVAFAAAASAAVPAGIGVNLVLLAATALLAQRLAPTRALVGGIAIWGVAAALVVWRPVPGGFASMALWGVAVLVGLLLVGRIPGVRGDRRGAKRDARMGLSGMLARAAGAGSIVALAVLLARVGGPVLGGLASVFPSGWLTTMFLLVRHHGPSFTAATTRVMIAGSLAPALFGLVAWLALPSAGLVGGLLLGLAAAGAASLLVGWTLARVDRAHAAAPAAPLQEGS